MKMINEYQSGVDHFDVEACDTIFFFPVFPSNQL